MVDLKDFIQDRQVLIEVNLEAGSYIIVPRTTGCMLRHFPSEEKKDKPKLLVLVGAAAKEARTRHVTTKDGRMTLSSKFETAICDIFSRFDVHNSKKLHYAELKAICDIVEKPMTPELWET